MDQRRYEKDDGKRQETIPRERRKAYQGDFRRALMNETLTTYTFCNTEEELIRTRGSIRGVRL